MVLVLYTAPNLSYLLLECLYLHLNLGFCWNLLSTHIAYGSLGLARGLKSHCPPHLDFNFANDYSFRLTNRWLFKGENDKFICSLLLALNLEMGWKGMMQDWMDYDWDFDYQVVKCLFYNWIRFYFNECEDLIDIVKGSWPPIVDVIFRILLPKTFIIKVTLLNDWNTDCMVRTTLLRLITTNIEIDLWANCAIRI